MPTFFDRSYQTKAQENNMEPVIIPTYSKKSKLQREESESSDGYSLEAECLVFQIEPITTNFRNWADYSLEVECHFSDRNTHYKAHE